jgi:hypothetical protein
MGGGGNAVVILGPGIVARDDRFCKTLGGRVETVIGLDYVAPEDRLSGLLGLSTVRHVSVAFCLCYFF